MRLKREEEDKARELKELEARLQKARNKRQLNEKLKVRHDTHSKPFPSCFQVVLFFFFLSQLQNPKEAGVETTNKQQSDFSFVLENENGRLSV